MRKPKWPKKPKSNNIAVLKRWEERVKRVAAKRKEIETAPERARKIKAAVEAIKTKS